MASEEMVTRMHSIAAKRKRSQSDMHATEPTISHGATNPYSRTPGQMLQFRLAGLNDTDADPSSMLPGFPHKRASKNATETSVEFDVEPGNGGSRESQKGSQSGPWHGSYREKQLHVLLQSIEQFLDRGDIANAAKIYAIVLRLRPSGQLIDIRHHDIWALGAEILMREGETPSQGASGVLKRWGSAANMNKVKAYFETLIQRHPYNYKSPGRVCALDFNLAMLGCEVYNAFAEHRIGLKLLQSKNSEESGDDVDTDGIKTAVVDQDAKLVQHKEKLRKVTLRTMVDITKRMDRLIQDQPYDKDDNFLSLRATASLYLADLLMPTAGSTTTRELEKASERRAMEQGIASMYLRKMYDAGCRLDDATLAFLNAHEEDPASPDRTHELLPIRRV